MLDYQINESISRAYAKIYSFKNHYICVNEEFDSDEETSDADEENINLDDLEQSEADNEEVVQNDGEQTSQLKVSLNQEASEMAKNQNFNTGFWSNFFSKDNAKEALKGVARAAVDTGNRITKMGTGVATLVGKSDWADRIDKKMDSAVYNLKHNELGSDYGDEVTNLSDVGGNIAGNAFSMVIPLGAIGKVGKLAKMARMSKSVSDGTKAVNVAKNAAEAAKKGSRLKELAIRGLKGYGWHGAGNEIGDTLDDSGFDTAADIARFTGTALGVKSALSPVGAKLPLNKRFMYGVPGGFGVQQGVHDVSSQLEKRGIISPETKKKMDIAGDYIGFGAVGAPLWNAGEKLIEKGVEKGVEHFVGGDTEQVPTGNEEQTNDDTNSSDNGENQQNNGNGGTEDVNLDDLEKLL